MFLSAEAFAKPFVAIWQFLMADKPEVTGKIMRVPPHDTLGRHEGFSYSVKMPNGAEREVYRFHDVEDRPNDYSGMTFVAVGSEGGNFYGTSRRQRFTDEPVTFDIVNAIVAWDAAPDHLKKNAEPDAPTGRAVVREAKRFAVN